MPTIDPKYRFIIALLVTLAIGISGGTLHLTNAIPEGWIPAVTAWSAIVAFVGSAVTTGVNAMAMTNASRLASASAIPEVRAIVTTQTLADATPALDKVVGPPPATGQK